MWFAVLVLLIDEIVNEGTRPILQNIVLSKFGSSNISKLCGGSKPKTSPEWRREEGASIFELFTSFLTCAYLT